MSSLQAPPAQQRFSAFPRFQNSVILKEAAQTELAKYGPIMFQWLSDALILHYVQPDLPKTPEEKAAAVKTLIERIDQTGSAEVPNHMIHEQIAWLYSDTVQTYEYRGLDSLIQHVSAVRLFAVIFSWAIHEDWSEEEFTARQLLLSFVIKCDFGELMHMDGKYFCSQFCLSYQHKDDPKTSLSLTPERGEYVRKLDDEKEIPEMDDDDEMIDDGYTSK